VFVSFLLIGMKKVDKMVVVDDDGGGAVELIMELSPKTNFAEFFVDVEEELALHHVKQYCKVLDCLPRTAVLAGLYSTGRQELQPCMTSNLMKQGFFLISI
jgi:hypothetical protein